MIVPDPTCKRFEGLPSELPVAAGSLVAFDTETTGLHPDDGASVSVVSIAWTEDDDQILRYAAYPFGQGPAGSEADLGPGEWRALLDWLARRGGRSRGDLGGGLVGHNSKFDILHLANRAKPGYPGRNLNGQIRYDTMVAARELWPRRSAALKSLAVWLFGTDSDAEQQALQPFLGPKRDPRFDLVPWEVMRPYAEQDAILTMRLLLTQAGLDLEPEAGHIAREVRVSQALTRMEIAGLPYDREVSAAQRDLLQAEVERLESELPFKPTLPKAKLYFFGSEPVADLGRGEVQCQCRTPSERTDKGEPKLTASVVEDMVREGVPYAEPFQRLQRYKSALSKWYVAFTDRCGEDGRVRTSFRQVASGAGDVGGTKSGRFSAGRINLQAVPKDYALHLPVLTPRQVVAAGAQRLRGWSLWELDLQQAELRTAALDAGCQPMIDAIRNGEDAHGQTATKLFGTRPGDAMWDTHRKIAKRANFSLIFGSGWRTFQEMVHRESGQQMSDFEAAEIVYGWRDLYPEFGRRIDYWMEFAETNRYVRLANGKRRWYAHGEDRHSAFNQYIQGSLAEYAKDWLLDTDERLRPLRVRGRDDGIAHGGLLLVVHDSQVLLLPDEEAEEICAQVSQAASDLWDRWFNRDGKGIPGGVDAEPW